MGKKKVKNEDVWKVARPEMQEEKLDCKMIRKRKQKTETLLLGTLLQGISQVVR